MLLFDAKMLRLHQMEWVYNAHISNPCSAQYSQLHSSSNHQCTTDKWGQDLVREIFDLLGWLRKKNWNLCTQKHWQQTMDLSERPHDLHIGHRVIQGFPYCTASLHLHFLFHYFHAFIEWSQKANSVFVFMNQQSEAAMSPFVSSDEPGYFFLKYQLFSVIILR